MLLKLLTLWRNYFQMLKLEAESQTGIVNTVSSNVKMDAAVKILEFPFIIIEAKHTSYSINAVLQGLQYYGITTTGKDFIDNNPCFLFTIDKRFLVYLQLLPL